MEQTNEIDALWFLSLCGSLSYKILKDVKLTIDTTNSSGKRLLGS